MQLKTIEKKKNKKNIIINHNGINSKLLYIIKIIKID